jgi:NitT/TauT family transport system substrate-binding protein
VTLIVLLFSLLLAACAPASEPAPAAPDSAAPESSESTKSTESTVSESAADDAATQELRPISLGVGFIPNVQFTPFYVGIEKGFYADEGLDVSLDYGFENDYLKLVGVGESEFMIGSGDQVIIGRAQGLPVRYVMNWYTHYPVVLMAKEEAGITDPADMAGRKIGLPGPFGANYVAFRGLLEAAGLSESDVQMESIGFTQAAALSEGTVDAALDYAANGPVVLGEEGVPLTVITLDPYLTIPANGLVTNDDLIENDPDLVQRMVRASIKAIDYTLQNPDEAFQIALKFVPEAGGENEEINRAIFDASLPFWTPKEGMQIGETRLEDWQAAAEFMQRAGLVDALVPAEELFTNEFIGQ